MLIITKVVLIVGLVTVGNTAFAPVPAADAVSSSPSVEVSGSFGSLATP